MMLVGAVIILAALAALGVALWGLFASERSLVVGVIALGLALVATGGAWYAWMESKSLPWTVGYGVVVVIGVVSAARQFISPRGERRARRNE